MYPRTRQWIPKVQKVLLLKSVVMRKQIILLFYHAVLMRQNCHLFLIFKRKTLPKEKLPAGVYVHAHPTGWMDKEGMKLWIEKVWSRHPGGLLKKPALLVWDQFRYHRTEAIKNKLSELKPKLAVIPGLTSQLQPLEVSINKTFKGFMKEKWNSWTQSSDFKETPKGRRQKPTISEVYEWVKN
jgi:hypothetical protein